MVGSMSKLICKAGSLRNVGKRGYRFHFSLHVETVSAVIGASEITVSFQRNGSSVTTNAAHVNRGSRSARFCGQVLERDVTLYKRKVETVEFEEKVFRLEIRRAGNDGIALGKIDLNLSEFVDIPTFSKRVAAYLSNGSKIVMRVQSTYLGEVQRTHKEGKVGSRQRSPASDVAGSMKSDRLGAGDHFDGIAALRTDRHRKQEANCAMNTIEAGEQNSLHAQLKKARDVNRLLKERNCELAQRHTELEHRLGMCSKRVNCEPLKTQNEGLRKQVRELRDQLGREPVYEDMLEDLLQTKLAVSVVREGLDEIRKGARVCGRV